MKPSETYSYLAKQQMTPDFVSLLKCYQPILGSDAFALYHYLWAFYDNGSGRYKISHILNHLNMGTQTLEKALDVLSALQLVDLYREQENYQILLKAPLSVPDFLAQPLYHSLLTKKIGEPAVQLLQSDLPLSEKKISKHFSEVFGQDGQVLSHAPQALGFDMAPFKQMMTRDQLRFRQEDEDTIALYHLAEEQGWNWLQTYQLAKETALDQVISTKRMVQKMQAKPVELAPFSPQEQIVIAESKKHSPLEFLAMLKSGKKATITSSERQCIKDMADLGLLDEVINAIVLYTFNKVDSANLNEKYAMKVANDFSYRGITSAEAAVQFLRQGHKKASKTKQNKAEKTSIPEWSNPDYKDETTEDDLLELEKIQQEILAKLEKGE